MRKVKVAALVIMCVLAVGLCGILAYGLSGRVFSVRGYSSKAYESYGSLQLVMEKEVPLDGIDNILVQYDMNSNDVYIYESEGDFLTIREYSELDLKEDALSTVTIKGNRLEVRGKKRNGRDFQVQVGVFGVRTAYGYTEIELPSSYKGQLAFATVSGDIKSQMDIVLEREFKASTSSGDVIIPNITAENVSLSSASGDIEADAVHAEASGAAGTVTIATVSGDIEVSQLTGEMDIGSTSGDITVKQLTGGTKIKSSSGSIESEIISGDTRLETISGDISAKRIDGAVTAESSSGSIKLREGSGERTVRTTSGDIQLEGIAGPWDVRSSSGEVWLRAQEGCGSISTTSGDVDLELEKLTGDLRIDSSSGVVKIRLNPDNAFDFEADTSSGDIQTFFDRDLNFSKKGNSANGTYGDNESGSRIEVKTISGDVQVED